MKLFSFDYFRSPERKKLLELQVLEQELKNELLTYQIGQEMEEKHTKPYVKLIYNKGNENITVVFPKGVVVEGKGGDALFESIKEAGSEEEIRFLLNPPQVIEIKNEEYTGEEIEFVENSVNILRDNSDFVFEQGRVFLDGIKLELPPVIIATFIEIAEKELAITSKFNYSDEDDIILLNLYEKYEALKMFWMWTALNPIENSRNDLYTFIKNNDISITKNGLLELYRRVVNVGAENKELVTFISEQYFKIKKWKKSPKNYTIWKNIENNELFCSIAIPNTDDTFEILGGLEDLYLNLPTMAENIYTDNHTKTKIIRVGSVYKEDEDKINLNNSVSCGAGLHAGARSFGFNGFGDTGLVVLVNPIFVRSVPNHESNKMRVSEMFIAGVVNFEDYEEGIDNGNLADYSDEYFGQSVQELQDQLKNKTFEGLSCQENVPVLPINNIVDIAKKLQERVVNI